MLRAVSLRTSLWGIINRIKFVKYKLPGFINNLLDAGLLRNLGSFFIVYGTLRGVIKLSSRACET
jgi:hypothetical protein